MNEIDSRIADFKAWKPTRLGSSFIDGICELDIEIQIAILRRKDILWIDELKTDLDRKLRLYKNEIEEY